MEPKMEDETKPPAWATAPRPWFKVGDAIPNPYEPGTLATVVKIDDPDEVSDTLVHLDNHIGQRITRWWWGNLGRVGGGNFKDWPAPPEEATPEPTAPPEIPTKPWFKVGDVVTFEGDYVVVEDITEHITEHLTAYHVTMRWPHAGREVCLWPTVRSPDAERLRDRFQPYPPAELEEIKASADHSPTPEETIKPKVFPWFEVGERVLFDNKPVCVLLVKDRGDFVTVSMERAEDGHKVTAPWPTDPVTGRTVRRRWRMDSSTPPTGVTRQRHYAARHPEPIDVIEGWSLGFNLGNVIKYISRAGRKPGEDREKDLRKALAYLHREVEGEWPE